MVSFLLHLYQPSYQEEAIIKKIADECYIPLVKFIKQNKNFNVTLNLPLSLLTVMERYGYNFWIDDIKSLIVSRRVELVGTGAYHPLLTKLPQELAEAQIIYNEYALGYFFGRRQGFEGENAVLISDLYGFFPPELAINNALLSLVSALGYSWVIADQSALAHVENYEHGVYKIPDVTAHLIVRNRELSNKLAFKRDASIEEFELSVFDNSVVALDGETFGHHNKEGILLLSNLVDALVLKGTTFNLLSDYCNNSLQEGTVKQLSEIKESSWGASDADVIASNPYPLWVNNANDVQYKQWELLNMFINTYTPSDTLENEKLANIPLWSHKALINTISDTLSANSLKSLSKNYDLLKLLNSDQFWWSSNITLQSGECLYDKYMIMKSLKMYEQYIEVYAMADIASKATKKINEIASLIK